MADFPLLSVYWALLGLMRIYKVGNFDYMKTTILCDEYKKSFFLALIVPADLQDTSVMFLDAPVYGRHSIYILE